MIRFLMVLLMAYSLSACGGQPRALREDEARIVAWYIEDLAHGNPRDPGEIALVGGSEAMDRLTPLLSGSTASGSTISGSTEGERNLPPRPIATRQERWASLRGLFRSGGAVTVVSGPNAGLVAPAATLSGADLTLAASITDAENNDRRTLDALVLTSAELDDGRERLYRTAITAARQALDTAAGAAPWPPPAP